MQGGWASANAPECRVVARGLAMANGIQLSPDSTQLYVTASLTRSFIVYNTQRDGSLSNAKRLSTPSMCDNIDVDDTTGNVFIACHPDGLKFKAHSDDVTHALLSPSEVVFAKRADIDAAARDFNPFQPLLLDDGALLSACSVAANAGNGRVLIGAVFGDTFLDCNFGDVVLQSVRKRDALPPAHEDEL